ncbi:hypothetical protein SNL152K_6563 [Streptomyces sp. NL15-2K]|nr:hypothetical protein SNL152K_6563 [Streptomyces sp. NL15-2K]
MGHDPTVPPGTDSSASENSSPSGARQVTGQRPAENDWSVRCRKRLTRRTAGYGS